jgi:hypothetical protein
MGPVVQKDATAAKAAGAAEVDGAAMAVAAADEWV